jgi:hypothetical protein
MRSYSALWQEYDQIGKRIWRDFFDTRESVSGGRPRLVLVALQALWHGLPLEGSRCE